MLFPVMNFGLNSSGATCQIFRPIMMRNVDLVLIFSSVSGLHVYLYDKEGEVEWPMT